MADYAIHDTTLEDIANTIRKKDGTQALIDPADYADRINLLGLLEEKTQASASICAFDDGADEVPIKSWEVEIAPTLSGVSSVVCTQTGKNLLDTAISETKTNNSVSVICDGNGKYTATGTATGGSANITFMLKTPCKIKSGMYFHAMNSVVNGNASITLQRQDNSTIMYFTLSPTNRIVDLSSYAGETVYSIRFYVVNGASFEMTLTPMLCYSNTATSFEPYTAPTTHTASLGRTIYGGEVDIVNGTGTDENGNDFTFTGQEVSTRLGYNAFWSDSGDTEVSYRSSGTITPVPIVPTLITKTITENGTYSAEDDDADGYSSVTVNVSSLPSGDVDDPLDIMSDYSRANIQNLYSCLYVESGSLKNEIVFQLASATGYEGFCINLDKYNLESGKTYNISFVLDVPTTVSFSGSYPWGIKYSATRIPASGSASTNTFNITPTVNFLEQTGSQNVSMQFEASSSNYLVVLLARVSGNRTEWIKMKDFNIQEVLS